MFISRKKHEAEMTAKDAEIAALNHRARRSGRLAAELLAERDASAAVLTEIIAMETPKCAPTAKKMAARAKAGLPASVEGVA